MNMKRQTEFELRKISSRVFDKSTLMTLYTLARRNSINEIVSIVSTGKEANVYYGIGGNEEVAIKIYAIETSDFKTMDKYIRGDIRFGEWKNRRQLIFNWAKKEFKNLSRIYKKVKCPRPIDVENNVLVMEFIGEGGIPAPRMKDLPPDDPEKYFNLILRYIHEMYSLGIVHGDLSEYNILNWNEPVIIDLSMGVLKSHPLADELLMRDITRICNYFKKFGIESNALEIFNSVKHKDAKENCGEDNRKGA
ncbi:MAG: serine protein kinase RIO [Candidatus Altiarchaeales archaeon]|nr:MAG: serine protein kinase RIO [Candidatus Altiarchaeales archaeon]RLI95514.1 MAG: serine protein kinase RIO [Candidatus Altiarchaeales archaeon]